MCCPQLLPPANGSPACLSLTGPSTQTLTFQPTDGQVGARTSACTSAARLGGHTGYRGRTELEVPLTLTRPPPSLLTLSLTPTPPPP